MKQFIKTILIINFAFLSLFSHAEEYADKVTQFKISNLQLTSYISSFIYFQGDDRNRNRLLNAKNLGDQAISRFPESEVKLKLKWQQVSDYITNYQSSDFDGENMSIGGGWDILHGELSLMISALESPSPGSISDIQVNLESILSRYMTFANSTAGGYSVKNSDTPLEEEIKSMDQALSGLAQADAKYLPLLRKWKYILGTLLAYNSNVAPFVVLHTFDGMRKMIAKN